MLVIKDCIFSNLYPNDVWHSIDWNLFFRYRPAYKAFRSDSSFNFMVFFLIFFFQFILLIYQTVGVNGSGYCGFVTAINEFDGTFSGIIFGLLTIIVAFSFAACTTGSFLLLTKVILKNKGRIQDNVIIIINNIIIILSFYPRFTQSIVHPIK